MLPGRQHAVHGDGRYRGRSGWGGGQGEKSGCLYNKYMGMVCEWYVEENTVGSTIHFIAGCTGHGDVTVDV